MGAQMSVEIWRRILQTAMFFSTKNACLPALHSGKQSMGWDMPTVAMVCKPLQMFGANRAVGRSFSVLDRGKGPMDSCSPPPNARRIVMSGWWL